MKAREENSKDLQSAGSTDRLLDYDESTDYGTTKNPTHSPSSSVSERPTLRSMLTSKLTQVIIINYLFLSFTEMAYTVLVPLVYSTRIEFGGLGFNPYQIGMIMGIWGFINAFVQLYLLGTLIRKYGAGLIYKISYASFLICFLMFPVSTHLARRNGDVGVGAYISIAVQLLFQFVIWMGYGRSTLSNYASSPHSAIAGAIHVIIAETTPKPILGSMNGIVQMAGCAARTIAPTAASLLFSISLERHLVGGDLVYLLLVAVVLAGIKFSLALPGHKEVQY